MRRDGPSDRKLLADLYNRAGHAMNSGDPAAERKFGKQAAEYFGESLHQSMPGYEGYRTMRTALRVFADAERCFQMMDEDPERSGIRNAIHFAMDQYGVPQDMRIQTLDRIMREMESTC